MDKKTRKMTEAFFFISFMGIFYDRNKDCIWHEQLMYKTKIPRNLDSAS